MPESSTLSPQSTLALWVSGALGFVVPAMFAWQIFAYHLAENVATWGIVFILDAVGVVLVVRAGNEKPYLQIGWLLAAACILVAIASNRSLWHWGQAETVSVVFVAIALMAWAVKGAKWGLWPYMAATYLSFVPQAIDFWHHPQPEILWVWEWTIAGCLFAIVGAKKLDFATTFVPWANIVLNAIICVLLLR